MGAPLIVRNVSAGVPEGTAFVGIDLEVRAGEAVGLTSATGADVSPFLDVVAGLLPPSAGEVVWGGFSSRERAGRGPVERYRDERRIRLEVGYLSGTASLLQNRTIADNICLPARYHLVPEEEVIARMNDLIRTLRLGEIVMRRPAGLPAGVRCRAELARALMLRPRVLVVDSPFTSVERESADAMAAALREHRGGGMAVLAAGHAPLALAPLCSRVLVLARGRPAGWLEGKDLEDPTFLAGGEAMLAQLERKERA